MTARAHGLAHTAPHGQDPHQMCYRTGARAIPRPCVRDANAPARLRHAQVCTPARVHVRRAPVRPVRYRLEPVRHPVRYPVRSRACLFSLPNAQVKE